MASHTDWFLPDPATNDRLSRHTEAFAWASAGSVLANYLLAVWWLRGAWWPLAGVSGPWPLALMVAVGIAAYMRLEQLAGGRAYRINRCYWRSALAGAAHGVLALWPAQMLGPWLALAIGPEASEVWLPGIFASWWVGSTWLLTGTLARRVRSLRPDAGLCPACGYNLTGNASGTCPECGSPAPPKGSGE